MTWNRLIGRGGIISVALLVVAAVAVGCGGTSGGSQQAAQTPSTQGTAMSGIAIAKSQLATTAPDARLLVVQTAQPTTPTASPVWGYLFGSPKTDEVYLVIVANGKPMGGAQKYATAKLSAEEWKKVPEKADWKIDSDQAYAKALAVSGAKGAPNAYMMGLITYKSPDDTSSVQPYVWNVQFDPGASGATTLPVDVNANTGEATVSKSPK